MANKFLAIVYIYSKNILFNIITIFSNANIKANVGKVLGNFTIHHSVEIRNASQAQFGRNLIIKKGTIINARSTSNKIGIDFGDETYIKENCYIDSYNGSIKFLGYTAIGQNTIIAGQGGITIGKYVMIGGNVYILSSNHVFSSIEYPFILQGDKEKKVIIEDNVWIGGGVIILGGVKIGKNSVVGAGSIVNEDIPENSIFFNGRSEVNLNPIKYRA